MTSAYAHCEAGVLVIGNDFLERWVVTQVDNACVTFSFLNRQTGRDYARPGSREFSVSVNGHPYTAQNWTFARVEVRGADPVEAVIFLDGGELAVEVHYQVFASHPVLRKWLLLKNHSAETLTLGDLDWEDLNLVVDSAAGAEVWADYFTRREKAVAVTMDDCALLVNDPSLGEGFVVATEAPGPLKRLEAYAHPGRIAVGLNCDDETIFERILAPGEEFQTPASFLLPFANPIPQDVIDREYARFVAEQLTRCDVAQVPTITINSWMPHETRIDRACLLEQIDCAAELGADAYQVDDGWFDRRGDWNDDRVKFPNGLNEIADYVHAHGMRFGLWMAVATADEASQVYRQHPEWVARTREGLPNRHPVPNAVTMCLDSDYYAFILDKLDAVIARCGVELLKLDLSAVRNVYAPGIYPGCFATNHAHRSARESHLRILERLFELVRTLKARHLRFLIDVTYELYGVMDGTDLALTQVADQNWFTNLTSPNEVSLRREIYQRGRVTRPWTLNYGAALLNHPNAPRYGLFSALTGHATFWGDLAKLDGGTRACYRRWFEWAKAQRAYSDFYRHYQVSNIFPVPDGVSSRDYRHAIPAARYGVTPRGIHPPAFEPAAETRGEFWDGVARLDERGEGPVFIFRPAGSREEKFVLRLPWVVQGVRYRVKDETASRELGVFDGLDLMTRGIELYISEPASAQVIVLRQA